MEMEGDLPIDRRITSHYENRREEQLRLRQGAGWIEFERTRELIRRHLPDRPLFILDVGGAAGIHAEWLAGDGHTVHLIDPVPLHIKQAQELATGLDNPFSCELGDARALDATDESADVVLLLGPLYHLTERGDRIRAFSEAVRVLRPGGLCFAAAISRYASLFDGLISAKLADRDFQAIVRQDLENGQHRNPDDVQGWFTTAYFHRPDEFEAEAGDAGFEVSGLFGIEGMAGWISEPDRYVDDPDLPPILLEASRATESIPELRGLSSHMLLVARKSSA